MYLNAYYIMNDQEIPEQILEEVKSSRNYADLRDLHNKKKEQAEFEYRGYFESAQDKDIITIIHKQNNHQLEWGQSIITDKGAAARFCSSCWQLFWENYL